MTSFSERLQAAKAAPRPTLDVQVLLDADLSARREELQAALDRARVSAENDQRLASDPNDDPAVVKVQKKLDALITESAGALVTLRFTSLPGSQWADITARCPVRLDAPIDRQYGYNMQAASTFAAPLCGVRVEDGVEVPLLVTPAASGVPAVDEWADLFTTITGHEFIRIMDAIYELNEYAPAQRIAQAKKRSASPRG